MAYFANTYKTWFQDETLVFPEHQKFSKSIKNPLRKLEKCETFSKNPMMMTICVDLYWYSFVFTMQINIFLPKYTFQMKIWANASHFPNFLNDFFIDFPNFWCSGKRRVSSWNQVLYIILFTKYAVKCEFSPVLFFFLIQCRFTYDPETKLRNLLKYRMA